MTTAPLVQALQEELVKAKMRHVQLVTCTFTRGNMKALCAKFLFLDSEKYKAKLQEITDRYSDRLELVKETKTTKIFAMVWREKGPYEK